MTKYIAIPGTWGFKGEEAPGDVWWAEYSQFANMMSRHGLTPIGTGPFVWSTDVDGASLWSLFGRDDPHNDWQAGAWALGYYLKGVPYEDRNIIAHSHGGQVALYAARHGIKIRNLVTIATPVRKDMQGVAQAAASNIGSWTHVYSDWTDYMQLLGGLFDGQIAFNRRMPFAHKNIKVPHVGHSGLLNTPRHWGHWAELAQYLGAQYED